MAIVKNLHLLTGVSEKDKSLMEHAGLMHDRFSKISFKILDSSPGKVSIEARQGKSPFGNYFPAERLIEIVHETFGRFFKGKKIIVHPLIYPESPVNTVDHRWINLQMISKKVSLKQIAEDTGIDYSQLSALVSGLRPLSQPMKALFWYYFLNKKENQVK